MTRYLVTSALPYANGPIHFGHVVGAYLPADVYVRTLRRLGEDVRFICGADEHGVAITIRADQEEKPYAEYVAHWRDEIRSLFDRLSIEFDQWSGTSISPPHSETSLEFFRRLRDNGYLAFEQNEQLYCPHDEMFLADRYVTGTCYQCGYEQARGDECPNCGEWLDPMKLGSPRCKICGTEPERRTTGHWYLDLRKIRDEHIGEWFRSKTWKPNVESFVKGLLEDIDRRPITRDLRWGVPLPPEWVEGQEGKVLYVWFDAPIGYLSFTKEWAAEQGEPDAWRRYWKDDETRLVHFIGKDNIPFHCLVFPSMLYGAKDDYVLPWNVPANEFYNLQGRKFNTSEGWYIPLDEFFAEYDAEVARFYLLSSMPETADSEWRWEDFQTCANASLADKIGNLVTRVLRFCDKHFDGRIPPVVPEHAAEYDALLLGGCGAVGDPATSVQEFRFRRAAETLVANAAVANVFVDRTAPWALRKIDLERCGSALNTCCQWIAWLAQWMTPFLPAKAQSLWTMLGFEGDVAARPWPGVPQLETWRRGPDGGELLPAGQALGPVEGLFPKLDDARIAAEIEKLQERAAALGSQ